MHETNNSQYIGFIDSNKNLGNTREIIGWAIGPGDTLLATQDFKIFNVQTNAVASAAILLSERKDVYDFYRKNHQLDESADIVKKKYLHSGFIIMLDSKPGTYEIRIKNVSVFSFYIEANELLDTIIQRNPYAKPELIVVDNFYANPDKVREYALRQEFKANENYHKGCRTERAYIPSWVQGEFSRLLNKKVTSFVGATGVFQYCVARDSIVYHYDTQEYAGMVYLSPNAPLQTGTQTFRSIHTKLFGAATDADAARLNMTKEQLDFKSFNGNNFYDKHNMELVDSVANVYNRLVIFNARALHAATSYYGDSKENARLFHLYFFNC